MAGTLHTQLPGGKGHAGERYFAEKLIELGDARSHVWAGVDYLPGGVPDLDVVFLHEEIGTFNIEVKAVSLEMIEDFGLNVCQIKDRSASHHPVAQAGVAQIGLRNYLGSVSKARPPFFFATAAFPKITRASMLNRFDSPQLRLQIDGMVFSDDLESSNLLWKRLLSIRQSPPRGKSPKDPVPKRDQVSALIAALDPGAQPKATAADRARGEVLTRQVGAPGRRPSPSTAAGRYLVPGSRAPVVFRGAPGTGKTVQLQEIAVAHARAGRPVLFTCYNKVLASTLRGIMSTQRLGDEVDRRVVVTHVDELRAQLADDELEAFSGLFGTICVDEAQDMTDESFDFLKALAGPDAEWFLADGVGQELYGDGSAFLENARNAGIVENLRRNYRNSTAAFLVAQAVFEHGPDESAVARWVADRPLRAAPSDDEMFDLPELAPGGELPEIIRLGVPVGQGWRDAKLDGYVAVFHQVLERLASEGRRRDLAVLCARRDEKSAEPDLARRALAVLGVPIHDQIDPTQRGLAVPEGAVRLCTIHSSRGIEAARTVILDFDHGISTKPEMAQNSRIMSYIALSRGQLGTTIVALDDAQNPYLTFVESLVQEYRRANGTSVDV